MWVYVIFKVQRFSFQQHLVASFLNKAINASIKARYQLASEERAAKRWHRRFDPQDRVEDPLVNSLYNT